MIRRLSSVLCAWLVGGLLSLAAAPAVHAQNSQDGEAPGSKVRLVVLGETRAVVEVDGERYVLTRDNPSQDHVTLVETDGESVTLEIDGERLTLHRDESAPMFLEEGDAPTTDTSQPVVLFADPSNGFFFVDGLVNGNPIRFLVDTGADIVTFSRPHADQLGIDYARGADGYATTASGITRLKTLKVQSISLEHITLYDVQISVVDGNFPQFPLLGGTVLNQLNMSRVGDRMELTHR